MPEPQSPIASIRREKISYHGCSLEHHFPWEHNRGQLSTSQKYQARPFLAARDGLVCPECEVVLPDPQKYDIDHLRVSKDEFGHKIYDNHIEQLRLICHSCNSKVQHRRNALGAYTSTRERKIPSRMIPFNAPEEIVRHDEGVPLVTRLAIKRIQDGWKTMTELRRSAGRPEPGVDYTPLAENPEYLKAISQLKLKAIVGSIAHETDISIQTVYHYLTVMKNEINGFIYIGDFPEGKLLDFVDPQNHRRDPEEVYRLIKPKRSVGSS